MITIRPSYLSMYFDCCRRTAAKMFWEVVAEAGFKLNFTRQNIGAATGTATHAGVAHSFKHKVATGELANATEVDQCALEALDAELEHGVVWDHTSPNLNTAQKQVIRQGRSYLSTIAPTLRPVSVEERLEVERPDLGIIVSGKPDVVVTDEAALVDLKTGVVRRWNAPQYGTYTRILRSHGKTVIAISEDYVPRVAITKPQPAAERHPYDIAKAEAASERTLRRAMADLAEFQKDGNPAAFPANPHSMLCGPKFCPAWGSEWCTEHLDGD